MAHERGRSWKIKNMIEDKIGGVKRDNRSPTEGTDFAHLTHCTCTVRIQRESCRPMCKQCQLQDLPIMIIRFIFLLVHFSSIRDFEMIVFWVNILSGVEFGAESESEVRWRIKRLTNLLPGRKFLLLAVFFAKFTARFGHECLQNLLPRFEKPIC